MKQEWIKEKATEAWHTIHQLGGEVVQCWGVSQKRCREYEGMATLMLKVSGFVHSGWVYVSLNEGSDLYEVRLMDNNHQPVEGSEPVTELFFDQLVEVIDNRIERGDMTDEEYRQKLWAAFVDMMSR